MPKSRLVNLVFGYVQGMNVLAAPFLVVMSELEAFGCFQALIYHGCPLYVQVCSWVLIPLGLGEKGYTKQGLLSLY